MWYVKTLTFCRQIKSVHFTKIYFFKSDVFVRYMRNKAWVPKFRLMRSLQPFDRPLDISEMKKGLENNSIPELRRSLRRKGILPFLFFDDRPLNYGCTGEFVVCVI